MKSDLASVVEDDPAEVVASADGASPPAVATLLPDEQVTERFLFFPFIALGLVTQQLCSMGIFLAFFLLLLTVVDNRVACCDGCS